ncbi:MAG: twin-arginine translocase subunit TatB [Acidobacteria bacterium]|nr:MAG: twin-arginine translocase subunit TatB [Acidobacteriota bacterium]
MFDIGGPEFLFLVVLALLVFGPRRLPQIGRQLGGFMAQVRSAVRDFRGNLEREVALEDMKSAAAEMKALGDEARQTAADLTGIGPPAPADPSRRLRARREDAATRSAPTPPPADAPTEPPGAGPDGGEGHGDGTA